MLNTSYQTNKSVRGMYTMGIITLLLVLDVLICAIVRFNVSWYSISKVSSASVNSVSTTDFMVDGVRQTFGNGTTEKKGYLEYDPELKEVQSLMDSMTGIVIIELLLIISMLVVVSSLLSHISQVKRQGYNAVKVAKIKTSCTSLLWLNSIMIILYILDISIFAGDFNGALKKDLESDGGTCTAMYCESWSGSESLYVLTINWGPESGWSLGISSLFAVAIALCLVIGIKSKSRRITPQDTPTYAPYGQPGATPYQAPYTGQPAPYGNQPAPYAAQPAPYGNQPAPYGNQPAPYGNQPAPYGNQPAPYGNQPAPYGNQPAPYAPSPYAPAAPYDAQPTAPPPSYDATSSYPVASYYPQPTPPQAAAYPNEKC